MTTKNRLLTDKLLADKPKSPQAQTMPEDDNEELVFGADPDGWDSNFLAAAVGYESYETFSPSSKASTHSIFSVKGEVLRKSSNASQQPNDKKEETTCCPSWFPKW
jgi:hypothetical protein